MRKRYFFEAFLLLVVWSIMKIPGGGDWYFHFIYPYTSRVLSYISSLFSFSLNDLFIYGSICFLLIYLFLVKKSIGKRILFVAEYLLCVYLFFYLAWGLNYFRSDFYKRFGVARPEYSSEIFKRFLKEYTDSLNKSYVLYEDFEEKSLSDLIKEGYKQLPQNSFSKPLENNEAKPMLFSRLMSGVGVLGYIGPFFNEYHVNKMLKPQQKPFTYAHEFSHILGISGEGEANLYAYLVCINSENQHLRFSGYYSLLPHVMASVWNLLGKEEYEIWKNSIRPEIRLLYRQERAYWKALYYPQLGEIQDKLYNWFLKSNRVSGGKKNYSEVVGMIMLIYSGKKDNMTEINE